MCWPPSCDVKLAIEEVGNGGAIVVFAFASPSVTPRHERIAMKFVSEQLVGRMSTGSVLQLRYRTWDGNMDVMRWNNSGWVSGLLSPSERIGHQQE